MFWSLTVNDLTPAGVFPRIARDACCTSLPFIVVLTSVIRFGFYDGLGIRGLCASEVFRGFVTASCRYGVRFHVHA